MNIIWHVCQCTVLTYECTTHAHTSVFPSVGCSPTFPCTAPHSVHYCTIQCSSITNRTLCRCTDETIRCRPPFTSPCTRSPLLPSSPLSSPHTCNDVELCPHSTLPTDVVVSLVLSLVHAVNYFIDLHLRGRGRGGGGATRSTWHHLIIQPYTIN